jgi:hypothetical protein
MGAGCVVVVHTAGDEAAGIVETEEQGFVQELHASQTLFCIGLLGCDEVTAHAGLLASGSIAFDVNSSASLRVRRRAPQPGDRAADPVAAG